MSSTSAATARLLHLALMSGLVLTTVIMAFVPLPASIDLPIFLYAVFGVAAVTFAGGLVIATRLPRERGQAPDAWWTANIGRALVVWVMFEGPSILGAVAYLLTRDYTALLVPMTGLFLLILHAPGRLEQA